MSRIGRMPITIPAGVTVDIEENNKITVKGPKGTLVKTFPALITFEEEGAVIHVKRPNDEKETRALHGLSRALLESMIVGVSSGFSKTLEINGIGYRAQKTGKTLDLTLGHSHPVRFEETETIKFEVPNPNQIIVSGIDKQEVGQVAAEIRATRPPEPYHGKGVKYAEEKIRRKTPKTGK